MNLFLGTCGHWLPEGTAAAGQMSGPGHSAQPVYLCDECKARAERHLPVRGVEAKTKALRIHPSRVRFPTPAEMHDLEADGKRKDRA